MDALWWLVLVLVLVLIAGGLRVRMLVRRARRYRYIGVIVGQESGHVSELFPFRREEQAAAWAQHMNEYADRESKIRPPLTRYEYRPLRGGDW
jgi:hypothetical protein